ncbi:MAG: GYD domain-containing protein [Candidatus Tectomicrobia bacterium]|nr:GYD domain-containing protein [Candidatus Tectomicrobia bacterium]
MATYIMLSTLTDEGRKTVKDRPERIKEVNKEIEAMGAKVIAQYAVLGGYDFVNVLEAPDNETIAKVSLELGARGTVQIMTLAAIPIDQFIESLKPKTPAKGASSRSSSRRKS